MKIDLTPIEFYKDFLKEYTDIKEVSHPDGHGLVGYDFGDGTFLSLDTDGNLNASVTPKGHARSLGAWERFYRQGFLSIHQVSGCGLKVYPSEVPNV
jgi:hypothetical protein